MINHDNNNDHDRDDNDNHDHDHDHADFDAESHESIREWRRKMELLNWIGVLVLGTLVLSMLGVWRRSVKDASSQHKC